MLNSPPGKTARSRGPSVLSASMVKTTVSVIILYWWEAPTLRSPNSRNRTSPGSRPAISQINFANIFSSLYLQVGPRLGVQHRRQRWRGRRLFVESLIGVGKLSSRHPGLDSSGTGSDHKAIKNHLKIFSAKLGGLEAHFFRGDLHSKRDISGT